MQKMEHLYRQIIMDHYKNPRHKGLKDDSSFVTHRHKNPSCGDDITIQSRVENGIVKEIRHDGTGCSICCSSASVVADLLTNKTVDEARSLIHNYIKMIADQPFEQEDALEDALAYEGVKQFPARIKCATIAWKALEATLDEEEGETVE